MLLTSPFGISDERINTIPLTNTHGRDLSLLELWRTESPIDLNEEEQSYIDFTKEYRSFDEHKLKRHKEKKQASSSSLTAENPQKPTLVLKHKSFTISLKEMQRITSESEEKRTLSAPEEALVEEDNLTPGFEESSNKQHLTKQV